MTAQARESLATHRERQAAQGRGAVYNTTAEERGRRGREGEGGDQDRGVGGRGGGGQRTEAMHASDARLRSELDRYRSHAPRGEEGENGGPSQSSRGYVVLFEHAPVRLHAFWV